ncbi:MAG: Lrp/AsnC family transcriptional regulator [Candidatus Bathyarchaeota archaeon]
MSESVTLDETDIQILEILQENCKLNFTQIGNELGIPESTIRYRIERLEKRRIINGYVALINPRKVGLTITAIMMIKINPQMIKEISPKLASFKELRHLFRSTGQYDMISVVNARDIGHLNDVMGEIKQIEGIHELIVEVATELVKVDPKFSLR